MIVIKAELWPGGNEEKATEIARAYIVNNYQTSNETDGEYGSYNAKFMQSIYFNPNKVWKIGHAEKIHRKKRGVWDILYVCLRSIGMEQRNKKR